MIIAEPSSRVSTRSMTRSLEKSPEPNQNQADKTKKVSKRILGAEQDESLQTPKKSARGIDKPLFQCTRDEAFDMGLQFKQLENVKLLKTLPQEKLEELNLIPKEDETAEDEPEVGMDFPEVEEISERSVLVGTQFALLLDENHLSERRRSSGTDAIENFALSLCRQLPDENANEAEEVDNEEIEDKYINQANEFVRKLNVPIQHAEIQKLALSLQEAARLVENGNSKAVENFVVIENEILLVLGYLHLIVQHDRKLAVSLVRNRTLEESTRLIKSEGNKIIINAYNSVLEHANSHADSGLQCQEQAVYHKMSLVMADLLLTKEGGINIGLLDPLVKFLVPHSFRETIAFKNTLQIVHQLRSKPKIWVQIANANVPASDNLPSCDLVRFCLSLQPHEKITKRHVQLTVLSALLGHFRQANAGTCFATAWLIKTFYSNTQFALEDFLDMIELGHTKRYLFRESRVFPFFAKPTNEGLDVVITTNSNGQIVLVDHSDKNQDPTYRPPKPSSETYLHQSPGIKAACIAMGLKNAQSAINAALKTLDQPFSISELINKLACVALPKNSLESEIGDLAIKGQYAYVSQVRHPLYGAWDQVGAEMVNYMGSQYMFPNWIFEDLKLTLSTMLKSQNGLVKKRVMAFLEHVHLPMICRMRYRYNPHIPSDKHLYEDTKFYDCGDKYYGYDLYDTGLPKDFEYSKTLYKDMASSSSRFELVRFEGYADPVEWKPVNSPEKFQSFILDVIRETMSHLNNDSQNWNDLYPILESKIQSKVFTKRMITNLFGRGHKNKFKATPALAPYRFLMGGWPDEVVKSYYSFSDYPVKDRLFSGSQREVLAWLITYLKKAPDVLSVHFDDPDYITPSCTPCHAFLLKPGLDSLKKAYTSELTPIEYIEQEVEMPGKQISNSLISKNARKTLIAIVAENRWFSPSSEKADLERQELPENGKIIFDQKVNAALNFEEMTIGEFEECIFRIVIESHAEAVGQRLDFWQKEFKAQLRIKLRTLVPNLDKDDLIPKQVVKGVLDYARNRKDTSGLSPKSCQHFKELMAEVPENISIKDFRHSLIERAKKVYMEERCVSKCKGWSSRLAAYIDTRLFQLLPKESQAILRKSLIVGFDTNWTDRINDIYMGFMVNPGTGAIELVCYTPDTDFIRFRDQEDWFRKDKHSRWDLPGIYRAYGSGPLFARNVLF